MGCSGFYRVLLAFAALLASVSANCAVITYTATSLGAASWRYDYVIDNSAGGLTFDEFTIYFDVDTVVELTAVNGPAGWDLLMVQPDTGIPADGFIDALKLDGPLSVGETLGGFSVTIEVLGSGVPGAQRFELIESADFEVVGVGMTTPAGGTLPEPGTFALALTLLLALREVTAGRTVRRAHSRATGALSGPAQAIGV